MGDWAVVICLIGSDSFKSVVYYFYILIRSVKMALTYSGYLLLNFAQNLMRWFPIILLAERENVYCDLCKLVISIGIVGFMTGQKD